MIWMSVKFLSHTRFCPSLLIKKTKTRRNIIWRCVGIALPVHSSCLAGFFLLRGRFQSAPSCTVLDVGCCLHGFVDYLQFDVVFCFVLFELSDVLRKLRTLFGADFVTDCRSDPFGVLPRNT